MPAFQVNHLRWLAPAEVLGPAPTGMLCHTPFDIVSDPRVQRIIVTTDNVDVPVHSNNRSAKVIIRPPTMPLASFSFKSYRGPAFVAFASLAFTPFKAFNRRGGDACRSGCASVGPKLAPDDQYQQRYAGEN